MPYNGIDHEITENQKEHINKLILKLKEAFHFGVNLNADERRRVSSVSAARSQFLDKVYEQYAPDNSHLCPPFGDLEESTRDYRLYKDLNAIESKLRGIMEIVSDTRMAVAHEAYSYARDFYSTCKQAKERSVPGADSVYEDLGRFFEGHGNRSSNTSDNTQNSNTSDSNMGNMPNATNGNPSAPGVLDINTGEERAA